MLPRSPDDLHVQFGTTAEQLARVLHQIVRALPLARYYVYLSPHGTHSGNDRNLRPRTIPAFISPDDAVSFAQRNGASATIRVRGIDAIDLLRYMLATPTIGAVVFLRALTPDPAATDFPPGVAVERAHLIQQIDESAYT